MYQTKTYFQGGMEVKVPISPFLIFFLPTPKTEISIYRVTMVCVRPEQSG